MKSEIKISAAAKVATIDIVGVIGVPEESQFDSPDQKVATYERFEQSLAQIGAIEADRVIINIRSTGGDVNDALLIYDAVKALSAEVVTRCYGYVASAATVIAQAASEGCRELSSNSLYLIHCCESACEGNSRSLSAAKDLLDKSDSRIAEIYAAASGREAKSFAALMNENGGKGRWLSPDEAVAAGLADRVIASSRITGDAASAARRMGLPPLPPRPLADRLSERLEELLGRLGLSVSRSEYAHSGTETATPTDSATPALPSRLATARATATRLREDPSTAQPAKRPNQAAYDADSEIFRNR